MNECEKGIRWTHSKIDKPFSGSSTAIFDHGIEAEAQTK